MRAPRLFSHFAVLARWLVALICLGILPLFNASVQADDNYTPPRDVVFLYPPSISKLCVGQIATFIAWYRSDTDPSGPPAQGSNTAPTRELSINSTASIGNIAPQNKSVSSGTSGVFFLTYNATDEGTAVIRSVIGQFDAGPITVKVVKACNYNYTFYAEINYKFTFEDISMAETYRFNAGGVIKSSDPADFSDLRDDNASFKYNGQLDSFKLPAKGGATINEESYSPAQGSASATAHGELETDSSALQFYMTKDKLNSKSELIIKITGKGGSADVPMADTLENAVFSFFNQHASQPDYHFIDLDASPDGGSYNVKVPDLDQVCNFLNQNPGFHCDYNARVDLEPVGE
jgi:hypothetical protein